MSDQSRALRVRSFRHFIDQDANRGAFFFIGTPLDNSLTCTSAEFASSYPTSLKRMLTSNFDRIAEHGNATAKQLNL
jgi:NTE family protein